MTESTLARLFEHNNWANLKIIDVCLSLSDEQLDADPQSAAFGSLRNTLLHLVTSQQGYLRTLTLPLEQRQERLPVAFAELRESVRASGEGFVALVQDKKRLASLPQLETRDGYHVDPWVIMVQAINHATEHREQIKMLLTALGVTPPDLDGWTYGEETKALVPISSD
jgi:uncharacterized damage-inducible protein DinB